MYNVHNLYALLLFTASELVPENPPRAWHIIDHQARPHLPAPPTPPHSSPAMEKAMKSWGKLPSLHLQHPNLTNAHRARKLHQTRRPPPRRPLQLLTIRPKIYQRRPALEKRPALLYLGANLGRRAAEDGHARAVRRFARSHGPDARQHRRLDLRRDGRIPAPR